MEIQNQIIVSGKSINIVTSTPSVDIGFGLKNYKFDYLSKVVAYLVWALNYSFLPIEIQKLRGIRYETIYAELAPFYYRTYAQELNTGTLSGSLNTCLKNGWIRRKPNRRLQSRFLYFPTDTCVKRSDGWKKSFFWGLQDKFRF